MSLLSEAFEECTIINRKKVNDDYGGFKIEWVDGAGFSAAIVFDSSMQAKIAEKQGVSSLYTITTTRSIVLEYGEYFRRERDGKLFRITSDGDDRYTPKSAGLDMRQVSAEEIDSLPTR